MIESLAVIPARSGSKGIRDKNICPLFGHPLLAWSVAAAKLATRVSRVIVSTDSPEYAAIARHYGAETPFLRPAELSADSSLDIDFILHALCWFRDHAQYQPDSLVHLRATNPIRDAEIIDRAIELLMANEKATSVVSVYSVEYPPCKFLKMNERGYLVGYMEGVDINIPRQQCAQAYRSNGYVDVLRSSSVLASGSQLGARILPLVTADPGDIDLEADIPLLEGKMRDSVERLKDYLDWKGPFGGI